MSAALRAGYKLTEVGVIPEDWEIHRLEAVAAIIGGGAFKSSDASRTGVRWLKIANVGINEILWQEESFLPKNFAVTHDSFLLREGDYVLALTRPILGGALKIAVVRKEDSPALLNQRVGKLVAKGSNVVDFVYFHFQTDYFISAMLQSMAGTDPPNISTRQISSIPCALPTSSDEQRAIATALSDVDALLTKLDALIAKKRDLKVATMQQLLTGQTRLPGFSGEWEVKRLGDVAYMGSGGTPPSSVAAYYDGDYPWVSIADMTKGGRVITKTDKSLSSEGLANSAAQMFPAGTILYAMYASLGECSIAGMPLCTSQAILGIRPHEALSNEFLYYYLTSLKNVVKSMGQQGTQANLNKGMVQAFELSLPKIEEQTAIATVLSDMDTELTALEARRDKTRAVKQGMMQELLTGRIRLI